MKNILPIAMFLLCGAPIANAQNASLKKVFEGDFLIGTAVNMQQIDNPSPVLEDILKTQFNAVTPENIMKSGPMQPRWKEYHFGPSDKLVAFAQKYQMKINGHALIWHSQLPAFMQHMQDADSVRQFFHNHITTVAARYNNIDSWDVVNEALADDGSLRKSIFLEKLGANYIVEAFRLTEQTAPGVKLYYNDYGIEHPRKRKGAIALIKQLQTAGVRIDGVGIQGHWRVGQVPYRDIEESIKEFAALGIQVMFTEVDLGVLPNPWEGNSAEISKTAEGKPAMNLYPTALPDSIAQQQAADYQRLFQLFLRYKQHISRITFWGIDDGQSWLNHWPISRRTNYPLLFDRQLLPKPAFYKIIETKQKGN